MMAVNKVVYNTEDGEQTLIDLTEDTVNADTLAEGVIAHTASGEVIVGIAKIYTDAMLGAAKLGCSLIRSGTALGSEALGAMTI